MTSTKHENKMASYESGRPRGMGHKLFWNETEQQRSEGEIPEPSLPEALSYS